MSTTSWIYKTKLGEVVIDGFDQVTVDFEQQFAVTGIVTLPQQTKLEGGIVSVTGPALTIKIRAVSRCLGWLIECTGPASRKRLQTMKRDIGIAALSAAYEFSSRKRDE